MIFVGTGPLYALAIPTDANHEVATRWHASSVEPLVTSDFIVYELVTLLRRRGHSDLAIDVGTRLIRGELAIIEWVSRADIDAAWATFTAYRDKEWSFTDCVSRVVMARLQISTAFAFDEHFRQFGTVTVVP